MSLEDNIPVGTVDNTRAMTKVMAQCGHWSSNNSNICFGCIGNMWGFIKHKGLKEEFLKWNEETDILEKHELSKQEVDWIE